MPQSGVQALPDGRGIFGGYHADEILIVEGRIIVRAPLRAALILAIGGNLDRAKWCTRLTQLAAAAGVRMILGLNLINGGVVMDEPSGTWGPDEGPLGAGEYQGA